MRSTKEQRAAWQRASYARAHARYNELKMVACMDCGFIPLVPGQMHFDHRPGEKKEFNISVRIHNTPWHKIQAEMQKCDLVCANCHALRTANRHASVV